MSKKLALKSFHELSLTSVSIDVIGAFCRATKGRIAKHCLDRRTQSINIYFEIEKFQFRSYLEITPRFHLVWILWFNISLRLSFCTANRKVTDSYKYIYWLKIHCLSCILPLQGSGAWPYAGLSSLKVKESLIIIQMVQILHTSANILHVCMHRNVLTMFQLKDF